MDKKKGEITTVRLRDWQNAIVKVAVLSSKQLEIVKQIDIGMTMGEDTGDLYENLGEIVYTNECPIGSSSPLYDGYYSH